MPDDWFEARDVCDGGDGMKPTFDEIVTGPVDSVHIEQMSDQLYWMAIEKGDRRLVVTFSSQGRFELE